MVVQGQPLSMDGVNVGMPVGEVQVVQAVGASSSSSSSASAMPPLIEAAEVFKQQLKVGGDNLIEVIDAACDALGVSGKGLTAKEKAEACWKIIHG